MKQKKIKKLLDSMELEIERLDKQYITNGKLNPIIDILSDKPIEIMGEQVINFLCNNTEYIVFEQTGLCIKKKLTEENKKYIVIKRYKEQDKEVFILSLTKDGSTIGLRVNKDGYVEIKKLTKTKNRKLDVVDVLLRLLSTSVWIATVLTVIAGLLAGLLNRTS